MDWKVALEVASPITIIFTAGMVAQQVRTLREETKEFRTVLHEWRAVLVRIGNVEQVTSRLTSDFRELRRDLGNTREKMASFHDGDD